MPETEKLFTKIISGLPSETSFHDGIFRPCWLEALRGELTASTNSLNFYIKLAEKFNHRNNKNTGI